MTDLHYLTLTDVADRIADGSLTSVEVTEAILARIEALEPTLHTYYAVHAEDAIARARSLDGQQENRGPMHGVPIAVKDLCHKNGTVTTGGLSFRQAETSSFDATVVKRLEDAGAVILGKLATTEGAMTGYHRNFDVPRNPWGLDRWPGVSSGGSGAATAAGLCFGSLGTDTGGSIRFPSAVNGLVGIKPTWGRVSRYGVLDLSPTFDHVGPMTRSVKDAARMLGVLAGHDSNDPTSLPDPVDNYEKAIDQGVSGLRIGIDKQHATEGVDEQVVDAFHKAIRDLEAAGAIITEVTFPAMTDAEVGAWMILSSAEAAAVHAADIAQRQDEYGDFLKEFVTMGNSHSAVLLSEANLARRTISGKLASMFYDIDVFLSPTLATESFAYNPEEAYTGINPQTGALSGIPADWMARSTHFVGTWDLNGFPTLSLPCGLSPAGLPLSLQFIGKPLGEANLCRAAFAYESANNFSELHPAL